MKKKLSWTFSFQAPEQGMFLFHGFGSWISFATQDRLCGQGPLGRGSTRSARRCVSTGQVTGEWGRALVLSRFMQLSSGDWVHEQACGLHRSMPPEMRQALWTSSGRGPGFLTEGSSGIVGLQPGLGESSVEQTHAVLSLNEFSLQLWASIFLVYKMVPLFFDCTIWCMGS